MSDASARLPLPLPDAVPQFGQNRWRRACAWLLARNGWRLSAPLPNLPKVVVIAAPHSSWWDGIWGLLFKVALGIDVSFMAKRELFRGPLGWLLRSLGGIPIERSAAHGLVEQVTQRFVCSDRFWIGITPEGTRKHVARWKTGFWHIAHAANVPILPIAFDYPSRTIVIGTPLMTSDSAEADVLALRSFYRPYRGRHRGIGDDSGTD